MDTMTPADHAAAAEALRAVLDYFGWDPAAGDFDRTLSGAAGAMLLAHMIEVLRFAAERDGLTGENADEFIRRYLADLIGYHTLAALDADLAASG